MRKTMDETTRRREKQLAYNEKHGITPQQIVKNTGSFLGEKQLQGVDPYAYIEPEPSLAADPVVQYMNKASLKKRLNEQRNR